MLPTCGYTLGKEQVGGSFFELNTRLFLNPATVNLVLIYLPSFTPSFNHSINIYWTHTMRQVITIQRWIRFYANLQEAHILNLSTVINEPLTGECTRCSRGKHKGCNSSREGQKGLHTGVRLGLRPEGWRAVQQADRREWGCLGRKWA